MSHLSTHRFLFARRAIQIGTLLLFWVGAHTHLGVLTGNLSSSRFLRTIPLSDPYAVLQILASGHLLAGTVLLGAVIVLIFYFLVGGRSFCAWVCPVNLIADGAGLLKRVFKANNQLRVGRSTRFFLMLLALIVSATSGVAAFEWVSPIGIVQRELIYRPGLGLLLIAGSLLILDLFVLRNGWCGSLCPLGAFYAIVGKFSPLRVAFSKTRCDRCGDCLQVCAESQVLHFPTLDHKGLIDAGACSNCGRCIEVCHADALWFSPRFNERPDKGDF